LVKIVAKGFAPRGGAADRALVFARGVGRRCNECDGQFVRCIFPCPVSNAAGRKLGNVLIARGKERRAVASDKSASFQV
jgi:hypothetical protein